MATPDGGGPFHKVWYYATDKVNSDSSYQPQTSFTDMVQIRVVETTILQNISQFSIAGIRWGSVLSNGQALAPLERILVSKLCTLEII